ncbi:hydrogenase, Fe-only [Sphaerochaeta pleomorpha str. Grapes]|uniref:Hydrogenase, Fe-only n=1 Tax=Sphaerochaeta pleomorpha (strain ATCC BAA-1885 / DSM 22778 / Grapes) TaxID=158190 RepID=G8QU93_SPHPG|nr:NADH-dependent [FeFe] hydrogenase, group A6 [Sphaerochaeta pleomorpha]AEV28063.1 hydrogenase, Fe-only [Sphaerochaeta pleomorpha str. Grapes]
MSEEFLSVTIDDKRYSFPQGSKILDACLSVGIKIPTLCYLKDVSTNASCGICLVEVKGAKHLVRSCITSLIPDMEIKTNTERIRKNRRINLELLMANHPLSCLTCDRNLNCELQNLAHDLGIQESRFPATRKKRLPLDETSPAIVRDPNKCILCNRCIEVCASVQGVSAIDITHRGTESRVSTFMDKGLGNIACTNCGQCLLVCPTGSITQKTQTQEVWSMLSDPNLVTLVQTAPAVRVALGEELGMEEGSLVTGKMVSALRHLGFSKVFDTQFAADLTIMEEGYELLKRMKEQGVLPMITSCSPGWIKYIEHFYPELLAHLSTCKSPQQMFGSIAKTYYAKKAGIDPKIIRVVSIMPCTAKKFEAKREEVDGAYRYWKEENKEYAEPFFPDVDIALTTRELGAMCREGGIDFSSLPVEMFDSPLGESTGAATLFGSTGGVMEAALRTLSEVVSKKPLVDVNFTEIRGMEGLREAKVALGETEIQVAVAHTLKNARVLLEQIKQGTSPYTFIEIMTCPGGCIGGGGQSIPSDAAAREKRSKSLYREDVRLEIRKSHENPEIQQLYKEFLLEPLGPLSHRLLHTGYVVRGVV